MQRGSNINPFRQEIPVALCRSGKLSGPVRALGVPKCFTERW